MKTFSLILTLAVLAASCGTTSSSDTSADGLAGVTYKTGSYNYGQEKVRYIALKETSTAFSYQNCQNIFDAAAKSFVAQNKTVLLTGKKVRQHLPGKTGFLVVGFYNETKKIGSWRCVRVSQNYDKTTYFSSTATSKKALVAQTWKEEQVRVATTKSIKLGFTATECEDYVHFSL